VTAAARRLAARPRQRSHCRRVILACTLAGTMLVATAAEAVTRHAIDNRITATARKKLTGPISAGIGLTPALLDAATGQIPAITITAPSTSLCNLHEADLTATFTDVHRNQGTVTTQGSHVSLVLTPASLTGKLTSRYKHATVTTYPATGSLMISLGISQAIRVDEKASLNANTITLRPAAIALFGRSLPLTPQTADKLTIHRTLSRLPLGLTPTSLSVTGNGLQINLTSGPATLSQTASHSCAEGLRLRGSPALGATVYQRPRTSRCSCPRTDQRARQPDPATPAPTASLPRHRHIRRLSTATTALAAPLRVRRRHPRRGMSQRDTQ
jgi:hypothetical protein